MHIQTESIGSIPRPFELIIGLRAHAAGHLNAEDLDQLVESAVSDTIKSLEHTGSTILTDGEQGKPSFVTYPISGLPGLDPGGVVIPFKDGHTRQLPRITQGPFRYQTYSGTYVSRAKKFTRLPIKQAVISASALSLLYPQEGIAGYSRDQFLQDLVDEAAQDIRSCFDAGAHKVQIDFTEARLSLKLDPSGGLLRSFIDLNNQVISRFSPSERRRIGIHSCPGGDHDSTHSEDISYADLLPLLFDLNAGQFYLAYAAEKDKPSVLSSIRENLPPDRVVFLGVTDVNHPLVETPEEIFQTIRQAAEVIPIQQLGTTDDCGFSPFTDDDSTDRIIAFAKIKARVEGTRLAESKLDKLSLVL